MLSLASDALTQLADDVAASAWLLDDQDPLRAYLSMFGALPADEEAWLDVLVPWSDDMQRGWVPAIPSLEQYAAIGAVAVSALRAARGMPSASPLAGVLHRAARWGFWIVRPEAH